MLNQVLKYGLSLKHYIVQGGGKLAYLPSEDKRL